MKIKCIGCEEDKAWAIVKDGKIHRITFSKSLADFILTKLDNKDF